MMTYKKTIYGAFIFSVFIACSTSVTNEKAIKRKKDTIYSFETKDQYFEKFNFTSKRNYLNDSTFIDNTVLCPTDTSNGCQIKFYISNKNWYIWSGNKWNLFYNNDSLKLVKSSLEYRGDGIIPDTILVSNGERFYYFMCRKPDVFFTTDDTKYLFHPDYGIVIVSSISTYFKRKDFVCNISDSLIKKR